MTGTTDSKLSAGLSSFQSQSPVVGGNMTSFLRIPRKPNCESNSFVALDGLEARVFPMRCNSWQCPRCAARMTALWARRVADAGPERFVTFTKIGDNRHDIRIGLQGVMRILRKRGLDFEYWGTIELHRSGVAHMHLIQKGDYIPNPLLKDACARVGWGHSDIRKVKSGFSMAMYCAKHLCHSHQRRWDGRLVRYSRGFFPKPDDGENMDELPDGFEFKKIFGRADCVSDYLRRRGFAVNVPQMGMDWIVGEEIHADCVEEIYTRDLAKGYGHLTAVAGEVKKHFSEAVKMVNEFERLSQIEQLRSDCAEALALAKQHEERKMV